MWYEVLNINQFAPWEEVQAAYRYYAKKFHPDSGDAPDEEEFKSIAAAYEVAKKQYGK